MPQVSGRFYKADFWSKENLKYEHPHFRMEKVARFVNRVACGRECDLLDVGCGPASLSGLLRRNIRYYGIDIAIHNPTSNLLQMDFAESPIHFEGKQFDIIVAQGVFEYMGKVQAQKFSEIADLLKEGGTFIVSYVNFDHRNKQIYWPYNNIQSFRQFREGLEQHFCVQRVVPTSHRWYHDEPKRRWMKAIQMHINVSVPIVSRLFAVENIFICSRKP
jgi:SAM-dependent methyltransferase